MTSFAWAVANFGCTLTTVVKRGSRSSRGTSWEWACYLQRILAPGAAEPMKPPILAILGYPPESYCLDAQPGVGLDCHF